jgi:phosphotransferase system  glucose/maltose/N-acetylglucosamine-specific IIC component
MRLKLKEDPKEWRKAVLFGSIGLGVLFTLLRFRHTFSNARWLAALCGLLVIDVCAIARPRWFRGFYRFSGTLGFFISRFVSYVILTIFFVFILTPLGMVLRLAGKDLLRLKPERSASSYWNPVTEKNSLDRPY